MKILRFLLGMIFSLSLMFIVLVSSIEIAAYSDYSFYQKEYDKYAVTEFVGISKEDLMKVTVDMMNYLKGERETLSDINAKIKGVDNTPFFNEREIAHMKDVRTLFITAIFLRKLLLAVCILCIALVKFTKGSLRKFLSNTFIFGTLGIIIPSVLTVFLILSDFEKYFIIFHHIFFNNDLWILDPATDNLINIVPQGFFMDMAIRIFIIFSGITAMVIIIGAILKIFQNKSAPTGLLTQH